VDAWKAGFKNSSEVQQLVADARAGHFNALIVQARKRGDAYYNSRYEPRATDISSSFDPLAELVRQAHGGTPRLEVHAWIVTFPIWASQTSKPSSANHAYNLHPEWLMKNESGETWNGDNYQLDPGHPGVQEHTFSVAMDIVSRYDVDGFHFDYIRYPGRTWGYNEVALSRFNKRYNRSGQPASTDSTWLQWRREQVTALVRKIYLGAVALKPQVKLSAATITWAPGITSDAQWTGTSAYASVLQDWRAWMQEGILDLNVPMAYFRQTTYAADWAAWTQFAKDHRYRRHVAVGAGIYLNSLSNSLVQIRSLRNTTPTGNRADGLAGFCYGATSTDATRADFLNALTKPSSFDPNPTPVYQQVVPVPDMPWKTAPQYGHLKGLVLHGLTGDELDAATVRVTGPASKTLTTDGTGFYGAVDLSPGQYTLTASFSGLVSQSAPVSVAAGQVTTHDFRLYPTPGDAFLANVTVSAGLTEAVVSWHTSQPATSRVEYGPAPNTSALSSFDGVLGTNHTVSLAGLGPDAEYVFRVISRLGATEYRSSLYSFRTAGQVIVDNQAASFSGGWSLGTSSADKYSADYQYDGTVSGAATGTATFVPQITTPGYYDVFVWYPQGSNRSASAPFQVVYDVGSLLVRVNQTTGGGAWRLLAANRHFGSGAIGSVQLANNTGESGKVVVADAVRWAYTANQEPPPAGQVPEWWAVRFFGRLVAGTADADGDGYSNYDEYLLGTDPARASSALRVWVEPGSPAGWSVLFTPCQPGRLYRLWSCAELAEPAWSLVPGAGLSVTAEGTGVLTDASAPAPRRFYRLEVHRAP